jgi:hypothetical protein
MANVFDGIDDQLRGWIARQRLFFVGTAPLAGDGHVNVSPKGPIESLAVVDFERPPRILRLHGRGEVVPASDARFTQLAERCGFDEPPLGHRSIVLVHVTRIADSCGYGVPLMSYEGERPHQQLSAEKRLRTNGPDGFVEYQREKNAKSIDGLPALEI